MRNLSVCIAELSRSAADEDFAKHALERYRAQQENNLERSPLPQCRQCASFALYRKNNVGNYECQTCGVQGISEEAARRIQ